MYCLNIKFDSSKNLIYKIWKKEDVMTGDFFKHRKFPKPACEHKSGYLEFCYLGDFYEIVETEFATEVRCYSNPIKGQTYSFHSFNDHPSVIYKNGTKEWHFYGNLHRNNGPAVIYENGDCEHWHFGKRHRKDRPAVIYGNKQYWYKNGEFVKYETV
jgi:hypothetical protein